MKDSRKTSGGRSKYESVIGLEVHCQLQTDSKLFCGCSTSFGALPNHHTCPVCLGMPGALPVLNKQAVDFAVKMAIACEAKIDPVSIFARKQYFYPDLPKGYQISQFDRPYCTGGGIKLFNGRHVRLNRIHLEEDAGKNIHGTGASYVDLNRAGVPLLEIVSEPDLRTAEEAADYLKRLRSLVRHLRISDGNLEEGSFRCDANVSIRLLGAQTLGTRCEIKNLNSFRNIEKAIQYEILRQSDLTERGEGIVQETLLYDAAVSKTRPMRSKEESQDYRYFPDPDLGVLAISASRIDRLHKALPELPGDKATRLIAQYKIKEADAAYIASDRDLSEYFENVVRKSGERVSGQTVVNWLMTEMLREINERGWEWHRLPVSADALSELLLLIEGEIISGKIAKKVFHEMVQNPARPEDIVKRLGLTQITDTKKIGAIVRQVVSGHPKQVAEYRGGKRKVFGFFVGEIMRVGGGKLHPEKVTQMLRDELSK